MNLKSFSIVSVLIFVQNFPNTSQKRIQTFSLYSYSDRTENFTTNVPNLQQVSSIVNKNQLQSVCSQTGVWAFFSGRNFSTVYTYGYHPATPGWTCDTRRIMADWKSPFQSIRHIGHSDLDVPGLSLYATPFFANGELFIDGTEFSYKSQSNDPIEFRSFGFTGRENWTLYSKPNFEGDSVCLRCKCDPARIGIGVTYTAKVSIFASSVRMGCFGSQVLLPTGELTSQELQNFTNTAPSKATLTLINSENNNTLNFSGNELNLPSCIPIDSFIVSSKSNWTVFSKQDFMSPILCLSYKGEMMSQEGTRSTNSNYQNQERSTGSELINISRVFVGSIRYGCSQNLYHNQIPLLEAFSSKKISSEREGRRRKFTTTTPKYFHPPDDLEGHTLRTTRSSTTGTTPSSIDAELSSTTFTSSISDGSTISLEFDPTDPPIFSSPSDGLTLITTNAPPKSKFSSTTEITSTNMDAMKSTNTVDSTDDSVNFSTVESTTSNPTETSSTIPITSNFPKEYTSISSIEQIDTSATETASTSVNSLMHDTSSSHPLTYEFDPIDSSSSVYSTVVTDDSLVTSDEFVTSTTENYNSNEFPSVQDIQPDSVREGKSALVDDQPPPYFIIDGSNEDLNRKASKNLLNSNPEMVEASDSLESGRGNVPDLSDSNSRVSISTDSSSIDENLSHSPTVHVNSEDDDSLNTISKDPNNLSNHNVHKHKNRKIDANKIHNAGTNGMFFTAFLIILGILVAAMLVTIGVFVYLRKSRSGEVHLE